MLQCVQHGCRDSYDVQVNSSHLLSLFIAALKEEDVTETMYKYVKDFFPMKQTQQRGEGDNNHCFALLTLTVCSEHVQGQLCLQARKRCDGGRTRDGEFGEVRGCVMRCACEASCGDIRMDAIECIIV